MTPDAIRPTLLEGCLLQALLEQQQMGVGVCDGDGTLVTVSPALEDALGAGYCATPYSAWAEHYHLHDQHGEPLPSGRDPLARALGGEEIFDEVISVRRPSGLVRWIRCSAFPLRGTRGVPIGAAVFAVDVTSSYAELRRLDDLRNRMVEAVIHEVRTPMATIIGHLELIEPSVPGLPEQVQWSLDAMTRAADRLEHVMDTIADLADQSRAVQGERSA